MRVGHHQVEVVREHAVGVNLDFVAVRCDGEDIPEDGVRLLRGAEEEAALGAASCDEVGGALEDLPRCGHAKVQGNARAEEESLKVRGLGGAGRSCGGHVVRENFFRSGR